MYLFVVVIYLFLFSLFFYSFIIIIICCFSLFADLDLKFTNILGEFHKFDGQISIDETIPESNE